MVGIEERVDSLAQRISQIEGEIDVRKILLALWSEKWIILLITIVFAIIGIFYALALPNQYQSEGIYAAAQEDTNRSLLGQYGGLAAIAGLNIGPDQDAEINQAMALVKSWPFIESFIDKYELKPYLEAVENWNEKDRVIVWNKDRYDPERKVWKTAEPTSFQAFKSFSRILRVNKDGKTGLVTISIDHYVPELSSKWVGLLVEELNANFKSRDIYEAKRNIEYLERKVLETSLAEMQSVFYGLIEAQTKKLMLAEVREEYLIQTIVPPKVAEQKSKPRRLVIVLLAMSFGLILSAFFFFWRFIREELMPLSTNYE